SVRAFSPGDRRRLELVETADEELPAAAGRPTRDDDERLPIGRRDGGGADPVEAHPADARDGGVTTGIDAKRHMRPVAGRGRWEPQRPSSREDDRTRDE